MPGKVMPRHYAENRMSEIPATATSRRREDANRAVVLDFYDKALRRFDLDAAAEHFGRSYIQHNPNIPDGTEGFRGFVQGLRSRFPSISAQIHRTIADGDFVMLHVHAVREHGDPGLAIIDIFRLEDGKIVEHWDVRQEVVASTAHDNGMF
jgi:predicted SnoaL-like aldol condensation-catalyzing enzyme